MAVTSTHAAQQRFQEADDAWHSELVRVHGKHAGDVRYSAIGRGTRGTTLRTLYDARCVALHAYTASMQPRATGDAP